jgi:hypothetical protein
VRRWGVTSERIVLEKACVDVRNVAARSPGAALRELERGVVGEGGPLPMRTATFEMGDATSRVYVTGHAGRFLKGRFTGPAVAEASVAESLAALAERLGREAAHASAAG